MLALGNDPPLGAWSFHSGDDASLCGGADACLAIGWDDVLGTFDATPLQFWVAVRPGAYLQLDDVVVTTRELPEGEPVTIAGVVTQVRARHEGAQFLLGATRPTSAHVEGGIAGGWGNLPSPGLVGFPREASCDGCSPRDDG